MSENRAPVLRTQVVALTVRGRRVMHPKKSPEQLCVAEALRIKNNLNRFSVARVAFLHFFVAGVFERAAGVAYRRRLHARKFAKNVLHSPKTPARQSRRFRHLPFIVWRGPAG